MKIINKNLLSFRSNCSAAIAIEFAYIAPILLFMSMLIIESSILSFYQSSIDNALTNAVRTTKITRENRDNLINEIKNEFKNSTYGIANKDNLIITTDLSVDFDTEYAETAEICLGPNGKEVGEGTGLGMNCDCGSGACPAMTMCEDRNGDGICAADPPALALGGPGDVITIIAVYKWKALTPGIKYFFKSAGNSSNNRNYSNILQANEDGDHIIISGMTFRNEE